MPRYVRWPYDLCKSEALKYSSRSEFRKNNYKAYSAAARNKWLDSICSHMEYLIVYHTHEMLQEKALKYITRSDFEKYDDNAYQVARIRGVLDQICSHTTDMHQSWTFDILFNIALNFTTKKAFRDGSPTGWQAAYRMGISDQICSHMTDSNIYWTFESLQLLALTYKTRGEFQKYKESAYQTALVRGILDQICSHMENASSSSVPEKSLLASIRSVYPSAVKLVDKRVNIIKKPFIKHFHIDIFIPELKKGIEFDGTYYHSFIGLKRGRPHWSDGDILNYHQIKDDYFGSKGIELIHIKEEDWNKDKEHCIEKCLNFLKSP